MLSTANWAAPILLLLDRCERPHSPPHNLVHPTPQPRNTSDSREVTRHVGHVETGLRRDRACDLTRMQARILTCVCVKPQMRSHVCHRVGPFWVHFGSILGPFLGPLCVYCGSILGPVWVHFGSILFHCLNVDAS